MCFFPLFIRYRANIIINNLAPSAAVQLWQLDGTGMPGLTSGTTGQTGIISANGALCLELQTFMPLGTLDPVIHLELWDFQF